MTGWKVKRVLSETIEMQEVTTGISFVQCGVAKKKTRRHGYGAEGENRVAEQK